LPSAVAIGDTWTMIDYTPSAWWSILLRVRGSVLPGLLPRIGFIVAIGAVAVEVHHGSGLKLAPIAHTILGVALGLLLVFRTNASYDRYWEGRRLLGVLVNRSRDIARQLVAFLAGDGEAERAERARLVRLLQATFVLAAQGLRGERDLDAIGDLLTAEEKAALEPVKNRHVYAAAWLSRTLAAAADAGRLGELRLHLLDGNLTALVDAWGGCERIVRTPIPFAYAQHIKSFLFLFCVTVPFAMVESMGWGTPIAAGVLAYAMFGIDEIGVEIEDPFGYDPNDLPLERIAATITADTDAVLRLRDGRAQG
jgi:putative membrane protein